MDFALLRAAMDPLSSPPTLVPPLDRAPVLEMHERARAREADLDARGEVRTRTIVIGPGKHFSTTPLDELKVMHLGGEVLCGTPATGRYLPVRVVSRSFRTVAVQFVVEDHRGRVVPVHLYHVAARFDNAALDLMFPLGAFFAIKEPLLRESAAGYLVRIDSPPDLVRLYPSSPLLALPWGPPPPGAPKPRSALENKEFGNALFARRQYRAALDPYSLALDLAPPAPLALTLLANRAATFLHLGRPGAALGDCTTALSDPTLPGPLLRKVLFRAASAEYQLGRFSASNVRLEQLLLLHPDDLDARDLHRRTAVRLAECTRGTYDWPFLFAEAARVPALDIASYTSSAFAPASIPGRGRGLVATRPIMRGELLLVSTPFAAGLADRTRTKFVVGANLFTETVDPYATTDLVALLFERLSDDPGVAEKLFDLHPGEGFPPWSSNRTGIDPSRLEAIVTYNAFHTESLASKSAAPAADALDAIHAPSTIYHTPSYMNHACLGNVSYSFLADSIFLRARSNLPTGTELVDSYVDAMAALPTRSSVLTKHNFICSCALCLADQVDGPTLLCTREALSTSLESLTDAIHGPTRSTSASKNVGSTLSLISDLQSTYASCRDPLRPALYRAFRLLAQTYAGIGWPQAAIRTELKALEALGAEFAGQEEREERRTMKSEPKVGDVNAVMSALFVAAQMRVLDLPDGVRHWIEIARRIEVGQAGEPLFRVRYAQWAEEHGLDLSE